MTINFLPGVEARYVNPPPVDWSADIFSIGRQRRHLKNKKEKPYHPKYAIRTPALPRQPRQQSCQSKKRRRHIGISRLNYECCQLALFIRRCVNPVVYFSLTRIPQGMWLVGTWFYARGAAFSEFYPYLCQKLFSRSFSGEQSKWLPFPTAKQPQ